MSVSVHALTVCMVLSAFAASSAVLAQDGGRAGTGLEKRFKELDKDGDGKLTTEELGNESLHKRLDRDGDGFVTLEEARDALRSSRSARGTASSAPPAAVAEGADVNAKPSPPPAEPPVSKSPAFTNLAFSRDCEPGTKDAEGRLIGGTETMRFLSHRGKLFASTGCWMDLPYGPRPADKPAWTGPQILVKESASAPWRVDVSFPLCVRVDAMVSATFATDGSGKKLDPPVTLLIASPSSTTTSTWTRDDAAGTWTETVAVEGLRGGIRSFCTHEDKATGVQHLFGGGTKGVIFRASCDPGVAGKLRWHKEPELSGTGRVMCMAEADGFLYAAAGIDSDEDPFSGGLFRRVDGGKPRWELLWRWPHVVREQGDETEILRGLTAIPDPAGGKRQVLLGTCNYPGVVYRIDPGPPFAVATELDIKAYFAKAFGIAPYRGASLSAYNNFLPAADPDTGEPVHLLGVWINHPDGRATELGRSAWYLVRHADGAYGHGRVFDPENPLPNPPRGLLATRTIELSPFPEDKGRVVFCGGFDCAGIPSRNTAWIYRGVIPEAGKREGGK
jgi:hypothetical protein